MKTTLIIALAALATACASTSPMQPYDECAEELGEIACEKADRVGGARF